MTKAKAPKAPKQPSAAAAGGEAPKFVGKPQEVESPTVETLAPGVVLTLEVDKNERCLECGQMRTGCQGEHVVADLHKEFCLNGVTYRVGVRAVPAEAFHLWKLCAKGY